MITLNVAAYCRVSTDKDDQTNSLINQRKYFAEYIGHHDGWVLRNIYYDSAVSGTQTQKRAGFNAMIEDAMQGNIDLILTKEVSRFARNTVDTLSFTRKLKEIGVGVIFTIDHIDTRDSDGELRLTIMASMAQEESRKTSERVKWGQKRRMEQGVVFGRDLLGYQVKNGKLIVNEAEAAIVRAIFHKYADEGKGTYVIARELTEEGMHPKQGRSWSNVTVLRVLKNEKYVGDLFQKKTITPNYLTHKKKYNHGEEELVCIWDHHVPIIERELWKRTQKELKRRSLLKKEQEDEKNKEKETSRYSSRYWCSGKIYCGECGQRYVSRSKILKNGAKYQGWRCRAAVSYGLPKPDAAGELRGCRNLQVNQTALFFCMNFCIRSIQVNREVLKHEIFQEIQELWEIKEIPNLPEVFSVRADTKKINNEMKAIKDEIEKISCKKKKTIDLVLEGIISREEWKEQHAWYEAELTALKQKLQEMNDKKIKDEETLHAVLLDQLNGREQYFAALDKNLDEILNEILEAKFPAANDVLYGELLEKMMIYYDHKLDIWLKGLSIGFRLRIQTSGRGKNFMTEILEAQVIDKPYK